MEETLTYKIITKEAKKPYSIFACFKEAASLTISYPVAFIGSTILALGGTVLTLGVLAPSLWSGLEGMYLKAKIGEDVKVTDVFMHIRKWFSLLASAFIISLHFLLVSIIIGIPYSLLVGLLLGLLNLTFNMAMENPAVLLVLNICSIIPLLLISYIESRYLHAFNLAAEFGLKGSDSRIVSKIATSKRWRGTSFVVLYLLLPYIPLVTSMYMVAFSLLAFPLLTGATAMAFIHDVNDKKIIELIKKYLDQYEGKVIYSWGPEVGKTCPTCGNSDVHQAYIENGGRGDWCPHCKMSLKMMQEVT